MGRTKQGEKEALVACALYEAGIQDIDSFASIMNVLFNVGKAPTGVKTDILEMMNKGSAYTLYNGIFDYNLAIVQAKEDEKYDLANFLSSKENIISITLYIIGVESIINWGSKRLLDMLVNKIKWGM